METFDQSAARLLSRASEAARARPDSPAARREIVRAIADALVPAEPVAPARWPYLLAAGVVFAVAATWALWPARPVEPVPAPLVVAPVPAPLPAPSPPPAPVEVRDRVFASGARLHWEGGSELEFNDPLNSVLLRRGEVAADAAEAGVSIESADCQVFVRGRTVVQTGAGCDGRALVRVETGESRVRSRGVETKLKAGETWPRCAAPKRDVFGLEQQNALYEEALAAQRAGKIEDGVRSLETLLKRAPGSALAETALAQEFRWLAAVDAVRAKAAARRYLSMFPMGPARAEAERLLAQ